MKWQAIVMTKFYNIIRVIPRWALYILTGLLGRFIMTLIHRGGKPQVTETKPAPPPGAAGSTTSGSSTAVAPATSGAAPVKGKGKKNKK
jgi:hypothetical protein